MYALIRSHSVTQKESYLRSVQRMAAYAMDHYGNQEFNSSFLVGDGGLRVFIRS